MNFLSSVVPPLSSWMVFIYLFIVPDSTGINKKKMHNTDLNLIYDFTENNPGQNWMTVNDNVMGGRSEGGFSFKKKRLIFSGNTNTNGGGFSSIRTKPLDYGLGDKQGLHIRFKGDGRTFKLGVRMEGKSVSYRSSFNTDGETKGWQEMKILFNEMDSSWRGITLSKDKYPLYRNKIRIIEFMIYDKQDGPFKLQVDWIKAY
jgi:hypothetical protein